MKRFYCGIDEISSEYITVGKDEKTHIVDVIRHKVGDGVIFCCGDGFDYYCEISEIEKSSLTAKISYKKENLADPKVDLTVFMALSKADKMELVLQKITELGASCFVPFESRYTVPKINQNKTDRLEKIAASAVKQCGRSRTVKVLESLTFKQVLNKLKDYDLIIFCNETEENLSLRDIEIDKSKKIAVVIGSEGGFSGDEINQLITNGAKSISLGQRILRAETAAVTVTALIMYKCEEI